MTSVRSQIQKGPKNHKNQKSSTGPEHRRFPGFHVLLAGRFNTCILLQYMHPITIPASDYLHIFSYDVVKQVELRSLYVVRVCVASSRSLLDCLPQIASPDCLSQIACPRLLAPDCLPQIASPDCLPQIASARLPPPDCLSQIASPPTSYLLPPNSHLLHPTCCLLSPASCILPSLPPASYLLPPSRTLYHLPPSSTSYLLPSTS